MKRNIKEAIDQLFEDMKEDIKLNGYNKQCQSNGSKKIYYSETILKYREKTLKMIKDIGFLDNQSDRLEFMRGFGRKTTPFLYFKKEIK